MQKNEVIATLEEMADLLEITEANVFEVMAYRNAAQSLEDWYGDLEEEVAEGMLTEIPAIGKGISRVISDLVRTGSADELLRVRGLVPAELPKLLRVRGLGPARVRALWRQAGVESPQDLRKAATDGRVQALRGFGAKTVERILAGLDYLQKQQARPAKPAAATTSAPPAAPKSTGKIWAGMSGYSYPEWKGTFYPADARPAEFLEYYAARLATVEINNTFYRFPSQKVLAEWQSQTPAHFRFAVKAHRRITHQARLSAAARDTIVEFVERCGELGTRLGCILFQLPPDFGRDDARLDMLLEALPQGPRYALEFRHASWFDPQVEARLRDRNVACVAGDAPDEDARRIVTADFVYTRLRRGNYTQDDLQAWDAWFQAQTSEKRDVLAYLKHDEQGVAPATLLPHWVAAEPSAARKLLKETLAKPAKRTSRTRRKTAG
ncbi:MAG: DUF72 domain-containing protein [Planctomycetota bacterium]|nr:MAG: DUF72 domain-containing protein [Planctomycetota bacterium]